MATIQSQASVEIEVPAARAFAFVADAANNPQWQRGMVSCVWEGDVPPIEVGSRYRQRARFLGRDIRSVFEVTEFDPGRVVAARTLGEDEGGVAGGFPITFRRSVQARGAEACTVSTLVTGDAAGFFVIAGPLMTAMVRRSIRRDYEGLKAVMELR